MRISVNSRIAPFQCKMHFFLGGGGPRPPRLLLLFKKDNPGTSRIAPLQCKNRMNYIYQIHLIKKLPVKWAIFEKMPFKWVNF